MQLWVEEVEQQAATKVVVVEAAEGLRRDTAVETVVWTLGGRGSGQCSGHRNKEQSHRN